MKTNEEQLKSRVLAACFGETYVSEDGSSFIMRVSDTDCFEIKIEAITVHNFTVVKKAWREKYIGKKA